MEKVRDVQYLSRLEIALGNLYYRLNKYSESLAHYDRAQKTLENTEDFLAIASIGLNRAYVLTEMNRFDEAVQSFEVTKVHCERHGMTLWAAIADRGISQMHFRRGNYSTALRILEQVRRKHEELSDARRVGLVRYGPAPKSTWNSTCSTMPQSLLLALMRLLNASETDMRRGNA